MAYLLKTIIYSGVLIAVYKLLLEKEKMHRFNRIYLIVAAAISFIAPLIEIEVAGQTTEHLPELFTAPLEIITLTGNSTVTGIASEKNFLPPLTATIYCLISLTFLVRFCINVTAILRKAKRSGAIPWHGAHLILLTGQPSSYSFFNFIFLDKQTYNNGGISNDILQHELAHMRQKHSLDIIFIELLRIFAWWNPFITLFLRAIRLNHEFLADESVVRRSRNATAYQRLLLSFASGKNNYHLTSAFNYSITKKRLIMITKSTTFAMKAAKQFAALLMFTATFATLSIRLQAQDAEVIVPHDSAKSKQDKTGEAVFALGGSVGSTEKGASEELMNEYAAIISKHWVEGNEGYNTFRKTITPTEEARLLEIFRQMSRKQQTQQKVFFYLPGKPFAKAVPTETQFNKWKDSKTYGIWINDKRVNNAELNKYKASDFSHFMASRLAKNAVNYGKHYVQVNLMTNSYYNEYYRNQLKEKDKPKIAFILIKPKS